MVCAQGVAGLAFVAALLWRAAQGADRGGSVLAQAAYFTLIGGGVLAVGVALLRGYRGARSPAIVVQVLLLGVAWYAIGPSGRPEYGTPVALICLAAGIGLLSPQARAWAEADGPDGHGTGAEHDRGTGTADDAGGKGSAP